MSDATPATVTWEWFDSRGIITTRCVTEYWLDDDDDGGGGGILRSFGPDEPEGGAFVPEYVHQMFTGEHRAAQQ